MSSKPKEKSKTENLFEAYLTQRGISFEYEPFGQEEKNPDYRFTSDGKTILAEIKEMEETPFQKELNARLAANNSSAFSFDPKELTNILRRRIDAACKQLKAQEKDADACVVILGQRDTGLNEIGPDSIFYALYGDLYLTIPIDLNEGKAIGEATSELRVNGAVRKNQSATKEMYSPHSYLSGVGVVEEFNGRSYYEQKFYDELLKKYTPSTAEECLKYLESEWEKHQDQIPERFRDKDKMFYRVRMIANPLSTKPFPPDLFNGEWDEVRFPNVLPA
jgi:hypothetical protein